MKSDRNDDTPERKIQLLDVCRRDEQVAVGKREKVVNQERPLEEESAVPRKDAISTSRLASALRRQRSRLRLITTSSKMMNEKHTEETPE